MGKMEGRGRKKKEKREEKGEDRGKGYFTLALAEAQNV